MKIIYTYCSGATPVYISNCNGNGRVLLVFADELSEYVYYCDDYNSKTYINRIKKPLAKDKYNLDNFEVIQDNTQFLIYEKFIASLYNYNGHHLDEKIDGNDINTKLWLPK